MCYLGLDEFCGDKKFKMSFKEVWYFAKLTLNLNSEINSKIHFCGK